MSQEEEEVGKLAIRLANAAVLPTVLKSAIELNVIDIISSSGDGVFLSPWEIASRLPTKNPDAPVMLDRMLRLLLSYDVLKCCVKRGDNGQVERAYAAAPFCKFLVQNPDGRSVGPLLLLQHDKVLMENWYHLNDAILEGGIPFNRAFGMKAFDYYGSDEKLGRMFNQAMSSHATFIMKKLIDVYKGFEGLKAVVDVGGSIGISLDIITSRYPHIKGINFDLPHVIDDAPSYPGVEHVGGDMFQCVPKGGDAIFMKWILHDWSDEHSLKILKNCWEALPNSGKLIIVEFILPETPENSLSSKVTCDLDLLMLAILGEGKERTLKEFEALAVKSGFSGCEVICSAYNSWVIEFHKIVD